MPEKILKNKHTVFKSKKMYLLDTDTMIYNLKGNTAVQKNLLIHINDPIKTSVITLMELYYGAYNKKELAEIRKVKRPILSRIWAALATPLYSAAVWAAPIKTSPTPTLHA